MKMVIKKWTTLPQVLVYSSSTNKLTPASSLPKSKQRTQITNQRFRTRILININVALE